MGRVSKTLRLRLRLVSCKPTITNRKPTSRWRAWRWMVCAGLAPALWACTSHRLSVPNPDPSVIDTRTFKQEVNHKLDLLFMVDNSQSMEPLQEKMSAQLGNFLDALVDQATGQLPDLHVAVVSSSFGAGAWGGVGGCDSKHPGDDGGRFVQGKGEPGSGSCAMLHSGAKFLDTGDGAKTHPNYDNDIRDAFKCMALLGDGGCGFESQFKSVYYALDKARHPDDPDNGGFLREDAILAIVMVTNEDDCSVDERSLLLTPSVTSVMDASGVGALFNYRCNEFGHVCGGQPPPHGYPDAIPAGGVTLNDCVSAENNSPKTDNGVTDPDGGGDPTHGHLWPTVSDFSAYIKSLKPDHPDDILVAAIAGPSMPYRVTSAQNPFHEEEMIPSVEHSCTFPSEDPAKPEFADPAVRINQWVLTFGENGIRFPICEKTLKGAMKGIADKIHAKIPSSCVAANPGWRENEKHEREHNCIVVRTEVNEETKKETPMKLEECLPIATDAAPTERPKNAPCFQLLPKHSACTQDPTSTSTTLFRICETADCGPLSLSVERKHASVACAQE
jgi:hypothetical protein